MTAAPARATVVDLTPDDLAARLDEALTVYVHAMGYPPGTVRRSSAGSRGAGGVGDGHADISPRPGRGPRVDLPGRVLPVWSRRGPGSPPRGPGRST